MNGLDRRWTAGLAGFGSALLLIGALGFQAVGYAPCEMCIWQRWPHLAAAVIAALIVALGWSRWLAALGLIAALTATGLAAWHAGIEWGWWQGVTACTGGVGDLSAMSTADLMARLNAAPVVRCDQPAWVFLGLSMAGWNALFSALLAGVWTWSFTRPAPATTR